MVVRPKLSRNDALVVQRLRRHHPDQYQLPLEPTELYREACEDEDGNPYIVIVWRTIPGMAGVMYTLEDGSEVKFLDDCWFEIVATGGLITRCPTA